MYAAVKPLSKYLRLKTVSTAEHYTKLVALGKEKCLHQIELVDLVQLFDLLNNFITNCKFLLETAH